MVLKQVSSAQPIVHSCTVCYRIYSQYTHLFLSIAENNPIICIRTEGDLQISPLFIVIVMDWQTCSHSGGGMRVHVFLPDSWACHDGRSTLSICRKSWKIYSYKVPLTIMLHDFVDRNYLSFHWCVPIYKAILRLNSLFPVYIKPAMQLSWYNKRGKVKKLFKRKSTEPLLTQTPTQSNFLWHYWGESHVPISIFSYYCDRPCHSRSFNPILSISQQITSLSHTQQKLIFRWGIGKHTDITKSGSNGVFAKVTENN